jgi:hypothetical protein
VSDPIPIRESLAGFIHSEPGLTPTKSGKYRFYALVGVRHWQPTEDGKLIGSAPTFHWMAAYDQVATAIYGLFH